MNVGSGSTIRGSSDLAFTFSESKVPGSHPIDSFFSPKDRTLGGDFSGQSGSTFSNDVPFDSSQITHAWHLFVQSVDGASSKMASVHVASRQGANVEASD